MPVYAVSPIKESGSLPRLRVWQSELFKRNMSRFMRRNWTYFKHWLRLGLLSLGFLLCGWLLVIMLKLASAAPRSTDAFFVLGGGIRREMYVAELAKQHPEIRILISQGSEDPCILLAFQREAAPIRQVWLEKCADSTFDNFYFNIPLLNRWGVRKIKLITSITHLPRAQWMAQLMLGAHGIWVEPDIINEQGTGNREAVYKTGLDLARSLAWVALSYFVQPKCTKSLALADVDLEAWRNSDFKCERQEELNLY